MSLWESGESTGEVSMEKLFAGEDVTGAKSDLEIEDICELICRGGWPGALGLSGKLDTTRMPPPSFRMVLVAIGDFAYRRNEDGIIVCPIGCLRP